MKYVFLALFCGAIFLCCFLIDKLLQKQRLILTVP